MITIDTRGEKKYNELIYALKAFYTTPKGEVVNIITDNNTAFKDLKKFLNEQSVPFSEIYNNEQLILQFTIK